MSTLITLKNSKWFQQGGFLFALLLLLFAWRTVVEGLVGGE